MKTRTLLADPQVERSIFLHRAWFAGVVVLVLTATLISQLFNLQVVLHEHYRTLSDGNRMRIEPVPPMRGLIHDRNGIVLAENLPSFSLELIPEQVSDIEGTLDELAGIIEIREQDLVRFRNQIRRQRRFQAVPVRFQLSEEEVARFAVNRHRFPGVDMRTTLARRYPFGQVGIHAIGYVSAISEHDLARVEAARYSGTTHFGKTGAELAYESILHGTVGSRQIETNAQGRLLRVVNTMPPVPGRDIHLTLDIHLQQAAEEALGEFAGSIVAIDPRTGEVLALVSRPAFDPNQFVDGIAPAEFRALERDPRRPLFNRALRGRYPPGSTVKPFLTLGAFIRDVELAHRTVWCQGYFQLPGRERRYRDWRREGHGRVDMHRAAVESCDVYYYQLALEMGVDFMHEFLTLTGFGVPTGIDLPGELQGLVPSREWKRRTLNESWFPGETVIFGIGQGYMLSTPLQLAHSTAIMANRGVAYRPHILRDTVPEAVARVHSSQERHWRETIRGMEDVVHGQGGTARHIAPPRNHYRIAGKTGTVQVFSLSQEHDERIDQSTLPERLRNHALFIAFAPVDEPIISLAVLVEHGGSGGQVAAPIARRVLDAWMELSAP